MTGAAGRAARYLGALLNPSIRAPGDLGRGEPAIRVWVEEPGHAPPGRPTHRSEGMYYYDVPLPDIDASVEPAAFARVEAVDRAAQRKSWVPYEGPRGGKGWKNLDSGDVSYDDQPPGETVEPTEPSPDDPLREGDRVLLQYDGEIHPGEVIGESSDPIPNTEAAMQTIEEYEAAGEPIDDLDELTEAIWEAGEYGIAGVPALGGAPPDAGSREELAEAMAEATTSRVVVQDDRNNWRFGADGSGVADGMDVLSFGQSESDQRDPDDVPLDSPDSIAYAIDGQDSVDASLNKAAEALTETGADTVYEALRESSEFSPEAAAGMLMESHGSGQTSEGHTLTLEAREGDAREVWNEFEKQAGEETARRVRSAASGWEGSMYEDGRAAPLVDLAVDETGNDTVPEYAEGGAAGLPEVDEKDREAVERFRDFATEKMREAFGDEVPVFRGFSRSPHGGTPSEGTGVVDRMEEAKESGEGARIEHRPAESWSTNPDTASLYADTSGAVVSHTIPVEDVVMSSVVGRPHVGEEDTVVQHEGPAEYDPGDIHIKADDEGAGERRETKARMRLRAVEEVQS